MTAKEVWVEGSFAGEIQIEEHERDLFFDDDVAAYVEGDRWEESGEGVGEALGDYGDYDDFDRYDGYDERECGEQDGRGARDGRSGHGEGPGRSHHNKSLGRRGEAAAAHYLERRGYEVLERNYTCPFGEADIIARDGEWLVFVEVKTRKGVARGFPSEAVDARKRARYEKIAGWYLGDYGAVNIPVRFDVVSIMVIAEDRAFLRHYVNAFGVGL